MLALFLLLTEQTIIAKPKIPALDVFASQFIETYLSQHPPFAANAGRHEFDGKLPDWSPTGLKKESQWFKAERKMAVLEKAGRDDLHRNLTALKAACESYAPKDFYPTLRRQGRITKTRLRFSG